MSGRPSGQKVPPYVAELETHRHRGLDFIFITQNPRLIDVNLRSLIEHHTHYSKTSLGLRRKLEWSTGGAKDPDSRASIREALVSVYRLDKSVYGYYKSAEVHTKIRTKRSKAIYIAPVAILAVGYGVWSTYGFIKDMDKPAQTAVRPSETVPAPAPAPVQAGQYPAATPQPEPKPERPHISAEDFEPRIDGQPHTAPIYDAHNTQIQTMPYPVACVKNADKCTCYTEQATPISGFDKGQCLDFVKFQLTAARRRLGQRRRCMGGVIMNIQTSLITKIEATTKAKAKASARERAAQAARLRDEAYRRFAVQFEERWGVKLRDIKYLTPTLTGGEWKKTSAVSEKYSQVVIRKGKLVEQIFRRGKISAHRIH